MMTVDKVANTPPLATSEGWPSKDTGLSGSQETIVSDETKKAVVTTNTSEEQLERHNVAEEPSSPVANHVPSPSFKPVDPKPSHQPVTEEDADADDDEFDTSNEEDPFTPKAACFYIGSDDTRSPHFRDRKGSLTASIGPTTSPWKVAGEGTTVVEFTPPDGGYSWVVALAACFINLWIIGFLKSYGVLYVAIREAFPEASAYHISWLPSLLSTVGLLTAPITGIMCRRFTSRKVSFFGGLLCFLGLLLGSLASDINHLIFTVGILTGLGTGITTTSGILIVSLYFERRRTFGSSVCLSGNALGGFFLPPLIDLLLKSYGLRGALMILSALQLNICAASMLFRPITHHAIVQAAERKREIREAAAKGNLLPSDTSASLQYQSSSSHLKAIWMRVMNRYASAESFRESELQHEVSFLRSASMMNSVPNLSQYARSWSIPGPGGGAGKNLIENRGFYNLGDFGSKNSLIANSTSRLSIARSLFAEHPSVLRLSSEDESIGKGSPVLMRRYSGSRRSSLPRNVAERRSSLTRQTSIRTVQNRIMESVIEQEKEDTDDILQAVLTESKKADGIIEGDKVNDVDKNAVGKTEEKAIVLKDKVPEEECEEEDIAKPNCCTVCLRGLCDASLFKDGLFWLVSVSVFLFACGTPFAMFYLPPYAESINIPSSVTTSMLSISSILDLVGRLGTGFVSDLNILQLHHIYFFSATAAGCSALVLPHITNSAALTAVLCLFGFCIGSWFVLIPAMLAAHHGASKLAASYGIVRLFNGIMNFISPQLTGLVFDATQSYQAVYTVMGTCQVTAAALVALTPLIRRKDTDSESNTEVSTCCAGNKERDEDYAEDSVA